VVSYVVNGGPRTVAPATAARVREVVAALGYRPNVSARALRTGVARMLGLVLPDIRNPFFAEFASAIEAQASRRGIAVALAHSGGDPVAEQDHILRLVSRQVDGLVVAPVERSGFYSGAALPEVHTVLINAFQAVSGAVTLGPDAYSGARAAVAHLIEHGHQRVAVITGELFGISGRQRGWSDALRAAGCRNGPVIPAEFSREGGYHAGRRVLELPHRPTAVFASSDMQAVGLLRALHEGGCAVPGDIAVMAFDGTVEAAYAWPGLSAVQQPIETMAEVAVSSVVEEDDRPFGHQHFPMELIVRNSCGCRESLD
jgi:LacI family transcriptional regulator